MDIIAYTFIHSLFNQFSTKLTSHANFYSSSRNLMKWGLGYSSVGRLLALYSAQDPSHAQYKLGAAEQGGGRRAKKSRLSSVS